jgi:preprotein translocase subunit SecF
MGFSLAIFWGVLVGTFSSIYVAASLLLYMKPIRGMPSGIGKQEAPEGLRG